MYVKVISRCILLFLMVLASQVLSELWYVLTLMVIFITVTLIKIEGRNFQQHGFQMPVLIGKYFLLSLFLAVFYTTIVTFLPGITGKFEAYPPCYPFEILEKTFTILLNTAASEVVFRSYIQTSLMSILDFTYAITVTSIMFTLYTLPTSLTGLELTSLILVMLSAFMESVFLCIFFERTKTLLCPIGYSASVALLNTITPIKPISSEYEITASVALYIIFILVLGHSVNERDRNII